MTILTMLSAIPKQDREALQKAHDAAADFHAAMSRAVMAEIELDAPGDDNDHYWVVEYQDALGAAAVAMGKMPMKWLAVLEVGVK